MKSGFEGEHAVSNHRMVYTWAWPSPQKWCAPAPFAASAYHFKNRELRISLPQGRFS
jgi:hypothetical protein